MIFFGKRLLVEPLDKRDVLEKEMAEMSARTELIHSNYATVLDLSPEIKDVNIGDTVFFLNSDPYNAELEDGRKVITYASLVFKE